jgi:hypothetical protein
MNGRGIGQVPFSFDRLFCQNMTFVSMLPFYFTGAGECKPFFGAGFGFHFWHVTKFMVMNELFF